MTPTTMLTIGIIAIVLGIVVCLVGAYAYFRKGSGMGVGPFVIIMVIGLVATIIGIVLMLEWNGTRNPEVDEPPPATTEDPNALQHISLNEKLLDERFPDDNKLLRTASLSSERADRAAEIKKGYGLDFSDAVEYPLFTKDEAEKIRTMSSDEEKIAAMKPIDNEYRYRIIHNPILLHSILGEWKEDRFFTTNNSWIVEDFEWLDGILKSAEPDVNGNVGWEQIMALDPQGSYDLIDRLYYLGKRVAVTFDYAIGAGPRGIELLTSEVNWPLAVGEQDALMHCVRVTDPEQQVEMYSLIYEFGIKRSMNGPEQKFLMGANGADSRTETYALGSVEKEQEKPKDNGGKGSDKKPGDSTDDQTAPANVVSFYKVDVKYVDEDDRKIYDSPLGWTVAKGGDLIADAENLSEYGYALLRVEYDSKVKYGNEAWYVRDKMPARDVTVRFIYGKNMAPVKITFKATDGATPPFNNFFEWREIGSRFDYDVPEWPGYEPDQDNIYYRRVPDKGIDEVVTFKPVTFNAKVRHIIYETGKRVPGLPDATLKNVKVDEIRSYTTPYRDGYIAWHAVEEIKIINGQTVYDVYYSVLPPDGEGSKNRQDGPTASGDADKGGGNRQNDDNRSPSQTSEPSHASDTVTTKPDGTASVTNRVDSTGELGAGSQSTTNRDTTGTGAKTDPVVTTPGVDKSNGANPPATNPIQQNQGTTVSNTQTNASGGQTTISQGTNNAILGNGVVNDID